MREQRLPRPARRRRALETLGADETDGLPEPPPAFLHASDELVARPRQAALELDLVLGVVVERVSGDDGAGPVLVRRELLVAQRLDLVRQGIVCVGELAYHLACAFPSRLGRHARVELVVVIRRRSGEVARLAQAREA